MERPVLSIGMIFKNEIRCLERCLKSLEPLRMSMPCELVMADTGSNDGSRQIAEKYADVLFDFPWINDFSAARNAVMDRCNGEWFLSLDADEWLEGDCAELQEALYTKDAHRIQFGFVIQRNYVTPDFSEGYNDFSALRLALMSSGVRFEGAIHETFTDVKEAFRLKNTILLHDGYALGDSEAEAQKWRRNLDLLAPLVEKDPTDVRRVFQCMESSYALADEAIHYARIGVDAIRQKGSQWERLGPAVYRQAVWNADRYHYNEEAEQWRREGAALFPDSPYTQIDLNCSWCNSLYQKKQYGEALEKAGLYLAAARKYFEGGYSPNATTVSVLKATRQCNIEEATLIRLDCLRHLQHYRDLESAMLELRPQELSESGLITYVKLLRYLYLAGLDTSALTCALGPELEKPESGNEAAKKRRRAVLPTVFALFNPITEGEEIEEDQLNRPAYPIFAVLDTDLGRAARLMDAQTCTEAGMIASEIQDWGEVPIPALARVIEWGVPLPNGFFRLGAETLRMVAQGFMSVDEKLSAHVLNWANCVGHDASLLRLQFLFELTIAAMRKDPWEYEETCEALYALFIRVGQVYTSRLYSTALIEQESDWDALPDLHRFTLQMLKGAAAKTQQQQALYANCLRKALEIAPVMKPMVEFLLKYTPELQTPLPSPELLELAEKVRMMLSVYPEDDQTVAALKASPMYQKVAYLIEGDGK